MRFSRIVTLVIALLAVSAGPSYADGGLPTSTTASAPAPFAAAAIASGAYSPVPGTEYLTVAGNGPATVHFDYASREALCDDRLEVFKIDSSDGSINGVLPGDSSWPSAVSSRNPELVFDSGTSSPGASIDLKSFQGGDLLAFRFTTSGWLCSGQFYSFTKANADGTAHVQASVDDTGQNWELAWEDMGGGGGDYNDMVVDVSGLQAAGSPDATPPIVSITNPADGSAVAGTVNLAATASDDVGVSGVRFQVDGNDVGGSTGSGGYSISWDSTTVPDGSHTVTAIASDAAGNQASASVSVLVANAFLNGEGVADTETVSTDLQHHSGCGGITAAESGTAYADLSSASCSASSWCASKNEASGTVQNKNIVYRNRFTHMTYWRAAVSVDVCINLKKGTIDAISTNSATVKPTYTIPLIWSYDNSARWSFGPTGNKTLETWAQVTDSFTGCPVGGLPVMCNKVTFTAHAYIYGNGTYRFDVSFHGA